MRTDLCRVLAGWLFLVIVSMAHGGSGGGAMQYNPPVSTPACAASPGDCGGE
jgi:hypothetical protein